MDGRVDGSDRWTDECMDGQTSWREEMASVLLGFALSATSVTWTIVFTPIANLPSPMKMGNNWEIAAGPQECSRTPRSGSGGWGQPLSSA